MNTILLLAYFIVGSRYLHIFNTYIYELKKTINANDTPLGLLDKFQGHIYRKAKGTTTSTPQTFRKIRNILFKVNYN